MPIAQTECWWRKPVSAGTHVSLSEGLTFSYCVEGCTEACARDRGAFRTRLGGDAGEVPGIAVLGLGGVLLPWSAGMRHYSSIPAVGRGRASLFKIPGRTGVRPAPRSSPAGAAATAAVSWAYPQPVARCHSSQSFSFR